MAPRPYWKGYLKVALVTCPVTLSPVTSDSAKIRFHTVNRATGNRVESRYLDAVTGDPVDPKNEVKGFPLGDDKFVLLEEEELAAVKLESTRTIDVACFVPKGSIGWIWLDQPHFVAPSDKIGEEAFAVIREGMKATGTVGVSRLVLQRREHAVMLEPRGRGILLWTLRYGDEVRAGDDVFEAAAAAPKPDPKALSMLRKLIAAGEVPWSAEMVEDPVERRLAEIVAAKKKEARKKPARKKSSGGGRSKAPEEEAGAGSKDNVVSILDALRRGVEAEKKS